MAEYELIVKFTRFHEDDDEVATTNYPDDTLEKALQKQFVAELQEGYAMAMIAGFFEVQSISIAERAEDSPSHVTQMKAAEDGMSESCKVCGNSLVDNLGSCPCTKA